MYRRHRKNGFTLVELLIVVLILGALAAIAIPRITASATTAKENACATNIDIMNSQIEMYKADTGDYPRRLTDVTNNTNYFPDGAPACPITGRTNSYRMNNRTKRVTCRH